MTSSLCRFLCGVSLVVFVASVSIFAEVEGTFVLEDSEESRFTWKQPELTIRADDEGRISAVLTDSSGDILLESEEVEVDGQEFKAIFTLSSDLGEFTIKYAGQVENGNLTGAITESMFGSEVKLVGKLKSGDDSPSQEDSKNGHENESENLDASLSQSIDSDIVGTYILDSESSTRRKPELRIRLDRDGEYSATLIAHKVTETDDIEVENNEFSATFTISTNLGDMEITYAGQVENGTLSGTITESMFGAEGELAGRLTKTDEVDEAD
ncbi:MAG: hypothetical protein F4W92_00970 [Gammaproteobacteria bacterium]|nr:hypothetical protein [Gammaproteobacteria bacterium]